MDHRPDGRSPRQPQEAVGTIDKLAVPKLRRGPYGRELLFIPRRRAEQALVAVVCQACVEGVSTRRVDDLVKAMGSRGSPSPRSRASPKSSTQSSQSSVSPPRQGPYRYLWIDALTQNFREGGWVVDISVVVTRPSTKRASARSERLTS
jgi:putative transposase